MNIGIIGNGFVGKATTQLKCKDIELLAYDINPEACEPPGLTLQDMNKCEIVFISVPTPMSKNGSCHLNIIKSVLNDLKSIDYKGFIVLRSTVPAGTCDKVGVYFMPEFLTEKNYINDFINNKDWVFGLLNKDSDEEFKTTITKLFDLAFKNDRIKYNNIIFMTNKEAEMVKMFKNCFLSTKVSFCNEIYELCKIKGINYENVRAVAANDDRILHSHTKVPGYDGKYGFGGTCFPKDTSSLRYEMIKENMKPYILNAVITRNNTVDRPEKDWNDNKGRAVINEDINKNKYNKTVLIAGGCGFIGSNLCKQLVKDKNINVICVDNLFTSKINNIKNIMNEPNFSFIYHNIINPLIINEKIDEIYNLACPASPPKYQIDPIYTAKTSFMGTINLLELAKEKNAKILFSSTSEIYGEPEITPQKENYRGNVNTIGIRSCYDEGKRIAETLMMDYHKKYNIDIRIARIFNTYGPNMDPYDGRVVTNFIRQILNNEDITIYGDGHQTRSFCYIDDLLDGLIKLMDTDYIYPINLGNPYEITIKQLTNIILELIVSNSNITYKKLPMDDPTNRKPDITLALKILNWKPKYCLKDGLIKTINYIKKNI